MNSLKRVVVTGMGVTSPAGFSVTELCDTLREQKSTINSMPEWTAKYGLKTAVASEVKFFDTKTIPRQFRRSMGRNALLAVDATNKALLDAKLLEKDIQNVRVGVSYGSTVASAQACENFYHNFAKPTNEIVLLPSSFLQMMSHTCATSIALVLGIKGPSLASCVACAASTQSIGLAYDAIRLGRADIMICGGAEELHFSIGTVFDNLLAASTKYNLTPHLTPKPFHKYRDGLVVGEGAGTLILEEYEHAKARNANIIAELIGFATGTDGQHISNPSIESMEQVMRLVLDDAQLLPQDINYINAHATGTKAGDISESQAIYRIFGNKVPVSSYKGHLGHLMGACGVVEIIASINAMNNSEVYNTLHLDDVDEECGKLNYIMNKPYNLEQKYILKNSFALGGCSASLIFRRSL